MKAVFNVYADPRNKAYSNYLFTLREVVEAIELGKDFHTNIMYEMDTCWFEGRYDVYLVDQLGVEYRICNDGKLTPKYIRPAHDIFKMWRSGSFCSHKENRYFK